MRVKCLANNGYGFSEKTMKNTGNTRQATMPLKVGEVYTVYGQMIYKDVLQYFVIGTDENLPSWYPAELFEVVQPLKYYEEYYAYGKDELISAVWGFKELVLQDNYIYDLVERENDAVEIFLKRKKEIDEFEQI